MAPYQHLPLIKERIRLLQLLPDPDPHDSRKPIRCRLFEHALLTSTSIHPFDALSYAWGSDDKPHTILIDDCDYGIGTNLHAALLHLRDRFIERYLWIDAICINQADNVEKGHQVQSMARIYSMATRVIVWLGEATANGSSNRALEEIRLAAGRKVAEANKLDLLDEEVPDGVLDLLGRPWFERVWVLQEVAAARQVLIKCGHAELDGYAFSVGIEAALGNSISQGRNALYSLVSSLNGLIRGAIIRPRQHHHDQSGRPFSLSVRPLSELLDIFRSRKATKTVDKVYALLGMSSDDPDTVGLSGDYNASWDAVSKKVVRFCLSNQVRSIETSYGLEAIVIKAKTRILRTVDRVRCQVCRSHGPLSTTIGCDDSSHHDLYMRYRTDDFKKHEMTFTRKQMTLAQDGDMVCLFQGASYPSIIRPHHDYWTVIIVAMRPSGGWYPDRFQSDYAFPYELLLVWDWSNQHLQLVEGLFEDYIQQRLAISIDNKENLLVPTSRHVNTDRNMAKFTRLVDTALIFQNWSSTNKKDTNFTMALAIFDSELRDAHTIDMKNSHNDSAGSTRMADVFTKLQPEVEKWLLQLAIQNRYDAACRHFVQKGVDINPQDSHGNTPLHLAAQRGSEATIQLLLNLGADIERTNGYWTNGYWNGETPLCCALKGGHEVIARMLCDKGADINGQPGSVTPLMSAAGAKKVGEAFVKFLLGKIESASINSTDRNGNTALHHCAFDGKAATLQLLLDQGAAIDHRNQYTNLTPLFVAVIRGNTAMVKRLLEYGADLEATYDIGRTTALVVAIHLRRRRIVQILLDKGSPLDTTDKYGETPLHIAVWSKMDAGHWASKYHSMLGSHLPHETMPFGNTMGTEEDGGVIVQMILERGADIEARSTRGSTPLHSAAYGASASLMMKLINFGANVNVRDDMGHTPLMKAGMAGLKDNVRLLLRSGCDVEAEDRSGQGSEEAKSSQFESPFDSDLD